MKIWRKFSAWGLVCFTVLNIAGVAYYFVLHKQTVRAVRPAVYEMGSRFPSFSGVDLTGAKWEARGAPCLVVRVTDDRCSYCRKDKPSYSAFLDAARRASCEVVELSPKAGEMAVDQRPGVVQLKFVDADIGSVLFPFATPQTVVLDRNWSLRWTRRGAFNKESLKEGMELLSRFAAEPEAVKSTTTVSR